MTKYKPGTIIKRAESDISPNSDPATIFHFKTARYFVIGETSRGYLVVEQLSTESYLHVCMNGFIFQDFTHSYEVVEEGSENIVETTTFSSEDRFNLDI